MKMFSLNRAFIERWDFYSFKNNVLVLLSGISTNDVRYKVEVVA